MLKILLSIAALVPAIAFAQFPDKVACEGEIYKVHYATQDHINLGGFDAFVRIRGVISVLTVDSHDHTIQATQLKMLGGGAYNMGEMVYCGPFLGR